MTFKIALVGEAYGEQEAIYKKAFVGPAGQELDRMLEDAGIQRGQCYVTNVFNIHPPKNDIAHFCTDKKNAVKGLAALAPARYLDARFLPELDRLQAELDNVRPNLTVALGNTACWALLNQTKVSKLRGTVMLGMGGRKVLPTYHPAAVLRQYELRHVTVLDLMKAKFEQEFPEIRRMERQIWLEPTLADIRRFIDEFIKPAKRCAYDIETAMEEITCIGFAPRKDLAICIPFTDMRKPSGSYWATPAEEVEAWRLVAEALDTPCEKVAQNGLYDIQYLWQLYGIPVRNAVQDTMLLHHSLQPESPKGLDFLGSVYCNEAAWKQDRPRGKHTIKRED